MIRHHSGERTRLACTFRRPAEKPLDYTLLKMPASRPHPHAGRVCSPGVCDHERE